MLNACEWGYNLHKHTTEDNNMLAYTNGKIMTLWPQYFYMTMTWLTIPWQDILDHRRAYRPNLNGTDFCKYTGYIQIILFWLVLALSCEIMQDQIEIASHVGDNLYTTWLLTRKEAYQLQQNWLCERQDSENEWFNSNEPMQWWMSGWLNEWLNGTMIRDWTQIGSSDILIVQHAQPMHLWRI